MNLSIIADSSMCVCVCGGGVIIFSVLSGWMHDSHTKAHTHTHTKHTCTQE